MTNKERGEFLLLIAKFTRLLVDMSAQREGNWIEKERAAMLAAVNQARAVRNLPDVDLRQIVNGENLAVGHSDYGRKFALYCAELVMDWRA